MVCQGLFLLFFNFFLMPSSWAGRREAMREGKGCGARTGRGFAQRNSPILTVPSSTSFGLKYGSNWEIKESILSWSGACADRVGLGREGTACARVAGRACHCVRRAPRKGECCSKDRAGEGERGIPSNIKTDVLRAASYARPSNRQSARSVPSLLPHLSCPAASSPLPVPHRRVILPQGGVPL